MIKGWHHFLILFVLFFLILLILIRVYYLLCLSILWVKARAKYIYIFFHFLWHSFCNFLTVNYRISTKNSVIIYFILYKLVCPWKTWKGGGGILMKNKVISKFLLFESLWLIFASIYSKIYIYIYIYLLQFLFTYKFFGLRCPS